jgi:hypothetical protein
VAVNLEQVFDAAQDPGAKQRFLSGRFNMINCPNCRYQGQLSTPLLYHDPDKELLLTFVPMELGLPQMEQEKVIGKLLNDVINRLPQEKRKGYLLSPKPAFTLQGMLERVLEAEGITKEMLDAQRNKVQLLQNLMTTPPEQLPKLVEQHDAEIDATLFQLLSASAEATAAGGNQQGAERMMVLQDALLRHSSFGRQLRKRQETLQNVARELQALGDKLTPDKLLELVSGTQDEERLAAFVSLVRPAMDYAFFEALTRRIDRAKEPEKARLAGVRDKLLELTAQVDQAAKARMAEATNLLNALMEAPDLNEAIAENLPRIDDTFLAVLDMNLEAAERARRADVVARLQRVQDAITAMMQEAAPPELRLINELLQMESDDAAAQALAQRNGEITQELIDTMNYVAESMRQNGQPAMAERLDKLRAAAVGEMMKANWQK